jgi:hypothetical protein
MSSSTTKIFASVLLMQILYQNQTVKCIENKRYIDGLFSKNVVTISRSVEYMFGTAIGMMAVS